MTLEIFWSYIITLGLSAFLVPFVNNAAQKLDIIAQENNRTIHHGRIARIGGVAIFAAFMMSSAFFLKADRQINAILVAAFIVFSIGFFDDIYNLKPKVKLLFEIIAACIVIFYGDISLKGMNLPFIPNIVFLDYISVIITFGWIIGITNAVNLIDGLDGLCAGISSIVLVVVAFTSIIYKRTDIAAISIILAGAICGFLCYNFHPASIFMGDCGALFIGFMISVISLLGFGYKSSAFFTLGAPIVMLAIPIMDTCIAIVRRKLKGKRFDEADREHLHHTLMFKLDFGQTRSVIILYCITILFALSAYLYTYNKQIGLCIFITLIVLFEVFVEYTQMISIHYRPILSIVNLFIKSNKLPAFSSQRKRMAINSETAILQTDEMIEKERERLKMKNAKRKNWIVVLCIVAALCAGGLSGYFYLGSHKPVEETPTPVEETTTYPEIKDGTDVQKEIYKNLMTAVENKDVDGEIGNLAAYFAADFFTWTNKTDREDVGGLIYVLKDARVDFGKYASNYYYVNFNEHLDKFGKDGLPEIASVTIGEVTDSEFVYEKTGNDESYDVPLTLTYVEKEKGMPTADLMKNLKVTVLKDGDLFYVVGVDYQEVTAQVEETDEWE